MTRQIHRKPRPSKLGRGTDHEMRVVGTHEPQVKLAKCKCGWRSSRNTATQVERQYIQHSMAVNK